MGIGSIVESNPAMASKFQDALAVAIRQQYNRIRRKQEIGIARLQAEGILPSGGKQAGRGNSNAGPPPPVSPHDEQQIRNLDDVLTNVDSLVDSFQGSWLRDKLVLDADVSASRRDSTNKQISRRKSAAMLGTSASAPGSAHPVGTKGTSGSSSSSSGGPKIAPDMGLTSLSPSPSPFPSPSEGPNSIAGKPRAISIGRGLAQSSTEGLLLSPSPIENLGSSSTKPIGQPNSVEFSPTGVGERVEHQE